jgi:tRNA threonylcarbamoyladenosine biosynthesis protein TsaB
MRFLVVDTADTRGSVALFRDTELSCFEAHSGDEDYSSWLLPAVRRILLASSLTLLELDAYAVCAGPGSFTGLRIGLTTVKAWAEIYPKPIAAVSRLEALATGTISESEGFVAAFTDARRDQVFAALYRRSPEGITLLGNESVTPLAEFLARVSQETVGQPTHWVTPDASIAEPLPQWQALKAKGHNLEHVAPPFALRLGQLAHRKLQEGKTTDSLSLDANYVRRADAELFWKGNRSPLKP